MNISRNPEDYQPSTHALQMRRDRDISWPAVGETIKEGDVYQTPKEDRVLFVHDIDATEPIGVVANPFDGEVITIEWRTEDIDYPKI